MHPPTIPPPHPSPHPPRAFTPPPDACDAHCHIFGPAARFPYTADRTYTPPDSGIDAFEHLQFRLGLSRAVFVQASCHGTDNMAMVDALERGEGRFAGVAMIDESFTDSDIARLHDAGVRGTRFNFVRRLVDFTPREVLTEIAHRIAPLGWHVVIYFEAADLPELWDFFTSLPTTVVVDHMGRPDVRQPVDGPEFELFVRMMREHGNIWSKVSCPERLSVAGPPALDGQRHAYRDVIPFARKLVDTFPDRVLWGTDWPHPNLKNHMPDDGLLVDWIPHIATTPELQQQLLVENPMRLYWG